MRCILYTSSIVRITPNSMETLENQQLGKKLDGRGKTFLACRSSYRWPVMRITVKSCTVLQEWSLQMTQIMRFARLGGPFYEIFGRFSATDNRAPPSAPIQVGGTNFVS